MPRTRICWTPNEIRLVAEEILRAETQDPGLSFKQTLEIGMRKLPENRRRNANTTWGRREPVRVMLEQLRRHPPKATPEPTVVPEGILQVEVPVVPDITRVVENMPTSLLIANLCDRFFAWVKDTNERWLASKHPTAPASKLTKPAVPVYPEVVGKPSTRHMRVAVVGLLKDQFQRVVERMGAKPVELVFINKDWSKTEFPKTVDHVICQRHIGHHWWNAANAQFPKDRVHFVDGHDTAVTQKIYDILSLQ